MDGPDILPLLGSACCKVVSVLPAGEKLAQSQANDVGSLCNLGVICFLRQLLDTGFFHVSTVGLRCHGVENLWACFISAADEMQELLHVLRGDWCCSAHAAALS